MVALLFSSGVGRVGAVEQQEQKEQKEQQEQEESSQENTFNDIDKFSSMLPNKLKPPTGLINVLQNSSMPSLSNPFPSELCGWFFTLEGELLDLCIEKLKAPIAPYYIYFLDEYQDLKVSDNGKPSVFCSSCDLEYTNALYEIFPRLRDQLVRLKKETKEMRSSLLPPNPAVQLMLLCGSQDFFITLIEKKKELFKRKIKNANFDFVYDFFKIMVSQFPENLAKACVKKMVETIEERREKNIVEILKNEGSETVSRYFYELSFALLKPADRFRLSVKDEETNSLKYILALIHDLCSGPIPLEYINNFIMDLRIISQMNNIAQASVEKEEIIRKLSGRGADSVAREKIARQLCFESQNFQEKEALKDQLCRGAKSAQDIQDLVARIKTHIPHVEKTIRNRAFLWRVEGFLDCLNEKGL